MFPEIEVTINDNDTAGVTISETSLEIREGATATYTVVLDSTPTYRNATVTINDPANSEITAEPDSLTFTSDNWNEPQDVTVTVGQDNDALDEAATEITHTVTSAFAQYDGLSADSVTVTVIDDDDPVVTVNFEHSTYSVAESDDASTTSEKENEVTVTVTLSAEPERTVDITLVPTNQGASDDDYSLSATSLTFGPHGHLQDLHLHG